jgi:hypothetical protein
MAVPNPINKAALRAAPQREVEPKAERIDQTLEQEWVNRIATRTEDALHHDPCNDADFDIAAWFAMDEDEAATARCMTECWYG